jgi:hypothetical protein
MHPDQPRESLRKARRGAGPSLRRHLTGASVALLLVLTAVACAVAVGVAPAGATTHEPTDLVAVAQAGVQGFCYWGDLQGPPPGVWQGRITQYTCYRGYGIPMYAADGVTQVGVFHSGVGGGGGGGFPDGRRFEETADAHGTVISTWRSAAGRITILRTGVDGTRSKNSAADDPSLRRVPRAGRPTTWRAITLWFRDVGPKHPELTSKAPKAPAWLVDRMSAAARAAGDPDAVARWTLTFHRCAAPLEGAAAPATDEGKYEIVWIAVLHGAFADGDWSYLILDRGSHDVISRGTSQTAFDTSMFRLQGRTQLH